MSNPDVTMRDVYKARQKIADIATKMPLISSPWLTELVGASVYLKLECLQKTGSFKIRGAANKILSLAADQRERGVITVSSGNHGRAVSQVRRNGYYRRGLVVGEGLTLLHIRRTRHLLPEWRKECEGVAAVTDRVVLYLAATNRPERAKVATLVAGISD